MTLAPSRKFVLGLITTFLTTSAVYADVKLSPSKSPPTATDSNQTIAVPSQPAKQDEAATPTIANAPATDVQAEKRAILFNCLRAFGSNAVAPCNAALQLEQRADLYRARASGFSFSAGAKQAIDDYTRAIILDKQSNPAQLGVDYEGRAAVFYLDGQYNEAVADMEKAVDLLPTRDYLYWTRANYYAAAGKIDRALQDYDKALSLAMNKTPVFNMRGRMWLDKKDYARAEEDFRKCYADHRSVTCQAGLGEALAGQGKYDKAVEAFTLAITGGWDLPGNSLERGKAYAQMGDKEKARADFQVVISANPDQLRPLVLTRAYEALAALNGPDAIENQIIADAQKTKQAASVTSGAGEVGHQWQALAERGDARAQYNLGLALDGDAARALPWYRKSADQGFSPAQYRLGYAYQWGKGVPRDVREAMTWYGKAAEQGNVEAQFDLAWLYLAGGTGKQDHTQAVAWFRKAADQGHAGAQYNLGNAYLYGNGVEKDPDQALAWYEKAAESGGSARFTMLGALYEGREGIKADPAKSLFWFRKAATSGDWKAFAAIGKAYEDGTTVDRDLVLAYTYYALSEKRALSDIKNPRSVIIAESLSADQLTEAKLLVAAWKPGSSLPMQSKTWR